MKNKIILLGVSILFSFLGGEFFCRAVFGNRLIMHFEKNGLYYFKPNQNGWYLLHYPRARINDIGARGADINGSKNRGDGQFVFFGDSFTFGWLLAEGETIPDYFRKEAGLPESRVMNLGNGGFGIDHMTALYRHHSRLFSKKDVFVMILPKMDFNRPMVAYTPNKWKETFWKMREKSSFISCTYFVFNRFYLGLKEAIENRISPRVEPPKIKPALTVPFFEKTLLGFSSALREKGQGVVFVFYEFEKSAYSGMAERFCRKHNLACMTDIWRYAEGVREKGDILYAPDQAHPSAVMNNAVGKAIARFVKNKK